MMVNCAHSKVLKNFMDVRLKIFEELSDRRRYFGASGMYVTQI